MGNAHLSRAIFEVIRMPTGCPKSAGQAFIDLYWKAQALFHHAVRIRESQNEEVSNLRRRGESLEQAEIGWLLIARTPSAILRFEFDAFLAAIYSFTNTLALAIVAFLSNRREKYGSFRKLGNWLERNCPAISKDLAREILTEYREFTLGVFSEFAKDDSPRDVVAHGQGLKCRPTQIVPNSSIPLRVERFVGPEVEITGAAALLPLRATTQIVDGLASYLAIISKADMPVGSQSTAQIIATPPGTEGSAKTFADRAQEIVAQAFGFTAKVLGILDPSSAALRAKAAENAILEMTERGQPKIDESRDSVST